jgi:hypothetical protein
VNVTVEDLKLGRGNNLNDPVKSPENSVRQFGFAEGDGSYSLSDFPEHDGDNDPATSRTGKYEPNGMVGQSPPDHRSEDN